MYLIFAGDNYYPRGGFGDFIGRADTLEDAMAAAGAGGEYGQYDWWQIVDSRTMQIVMEG